MKPSNQTCPVTGDAVVFLDDIIAKEKSAAAVAAAAKPPTPAPAPAPKAVVPAAVAVPPARPVSNLLNADGLLAAIWPDQASRPSARWLGDRAKLGDLPSVTIGGLRFFDPVAVRASLMAPTLSDVESATLSTADIYARLEAISDPAMKRAYYERYIKGRAHKN